MQEEDVSALANVPAEVEEAIAAFLRGLIAADYSMRTIKASAIDLEQFASFLGRRGVERPSAITRGDVSDFAAALADPGSAAPGPFPPLPPGQGPERGREARRPYARSTIARKLSVVRSFLGFCEDNGLLEASPGAGVGSPKVPRRLPQVLTPEQAAGLLEVIGGDKAA